MNHHVVLENIKKRRSIRKYTAAPVPRETLDRILEAGLWAPSANNNQPWHFCVITKAELIDSINSQGKAFLAKSDNAHHAERGKDPAYHVFFHAPCLILACHDGGKWSPVDTGLASQNMMLMAHAMGLGTCFVGMLTPFLQSDEGKALLASLPVPEGYIASHFITLGTPAAPAQERARKEGTVSFA